MRSNQYSEKLPSSIYDTGPVWGTFFDSPKNHLTAYATSAQAAYPPSGPHTHHDGQEQILEFIAEAQGVSAKQGKVPLHQLGEGAGEEKGNTRKDVMLELSLPETFPMLQGPLLTRPPTPPVSQACHIPSPQPACSKCTPSPQSEHVRSLLTMKAREVKRKPAISLTYGPWLMTSRRPRKKDIGSAC